MKKSTILLLIVFFCLVSFAIANSLKSVDCSLLFSKSGSNYVPTGNYANLSLKYYYFIPLKVRMQRNKPTAVLTLVPGLSGSGEDMANNKTFLDFAAKEGLVIIAPTFIEDAQNWDSQTSYQYPRAWSGKAFNDILLNFSKGEKIKISSLYLLGFSAGAQFVSRYSLIYPNWVTACAINAAGGTDDIQNHQTTKFYYAVGKKDEFERQQTANKFYNQAKFFGIDIILKKYDCGHELNEGEINDELKFFDGIINSKQRS